MQLQNNADRDSRESRPATVSTVNQFLLTRITKRLYEDLAEQELLWRVAGYLGSIDNKLRNDRVFWGVALTEEESNATNSLKLTIPKEVLERSGTKTRDRVCASGVLRVSQQFKASSFEVYLFVTDIQLLDAPSVLPSRREEASTLQTLKALAGNRTGFPTKVRPRISVIHSRSQEAQVYNDFCQPLRPLERELQLEAIPANMLSVSELVQAVRQATGDVLLLIRGGGSEEQFGVFDHPDLLHAWAAKPVYRIVGVGHSANSTALDLLSNFVATTPAAAGAHLADLLRNTRDTQQTVATLRTENEELRLRVRERENQLQRVAVVDHSATEPSPVTTHDQDAPTRFGRALTLALVIGILVGIIVVMLFLHLR